VTRTVHRRREKYAEPRNLTVSQASKVVRGAVVGLCLGAACAAQPRAPEAQDEAATTRATDTSAPTLEELGNATYRGVEEAHGPFALAHGRWEGKPFVEGGAAAPSVTLARGFRLVGDLDDDGHEEAVVLLAAAAGGTGETLYLAVVARRGARLENVATAPVGDRVQVRDARIAQRHVVLDVVQAGERDAMCCPGDLVTRSWELRSAGLGELPPSPTGRLSVETLGGNVWILRAWAWDEPAPATPEVTLELRGNNLVGTAGCNRYTASLQGGDAPGDLRVGLAGATKMLCPPPAMAVETRFLRQLGGVQQLRFLAGQLALPYRTERASGVMLFERR